jgi:hypothetical protein
MIDRYHYHYRITGYTAGNAETVTVCGPAEAIADEVWHTLNNFHAIRVEPVPAEPESEWTEPEWIEFDLDPALLADLRRRIEQREETAA